MRRADRLFEIIELLRRACGPITAEMIASELEVSKRTVYRDIASLVARRVPIDGEAGVGYVLAKGFDLPPLMLTSIEVEALTLGAHWVAENADTALACAAYGVLAKVAEILPEPLQQLLHYPAVSTPACFVAKDISFDIARVRDCCRKRRKISLRYVDAQGNLSERTVWPFMVGYITGATAVIAWCELRGDFRVFMVNKIEKMVFLEICYPESPLILRKRWLDSHRNNVRK